MKNLNSKVLLIIFVCTFILKINTSGQESIDIENDSVMNGLLESISKSIQNDSLFDSLYYWRSLVYFQMNKNNKALIDIKKAIELDSTKDGYFVHMGDIYYAQKKFTLAINGYNKALMLDSLNFLTFNKLIRSYYENQSYYQVLYKMEKALNIAMYNFNDIPETSYYFEVKDILDSIYEHYKNEFRVDSTKNHLFFNLGYCAYLKNDFHDAKDYLVQYESEFSPYERNPYWAFLLGIIYTIEKDTIKSKEYLLTAYKNNIQLPKFLEKYIGVINKAKK